jgi:hypothetical protein
MNMAICLELLGRRWRQGLAVLLASLVLVAPAAAVESWPLSDEAGHRFQASVFEQPFPKHPSGWRLRPRPHRRSAGQRRHGTALDPG